MFALAFSALSVPDLPAAPQWRMIAESERGAMAFDPASVERQGALRLVWTRAAMIDDDGAAMTVLMLNEVDCAGRAYAKLRYIPLDEKGAPVDDTPVERASLPLSPGSVGQALYEQVCS